MKIPWISRIAVNVFGALSLLLLSLSSAPAFSQNQTCGNAVAQLQQYVAGVNNFANAEYYQNIPVRCGGNQQCMYMWLQQLNGWYMQQANMVNGWYQKISNSCTSDSEPQASSRRVKKKLPRDAPPELDEEDIASLDVDDEDKTVRIRIPSNPTGYRR